MIDLFLIYSFIRRLATPFKDWEAFKLGIIDENGNVLKKRKDLLTVRERQAFGVFDVMVLNLKKLLAKVPGGSSRLASYAAALYLIREWNHFSDSTLLTEDISDEEIIESINQLYNGYSDYTTLIETVNQKVTSLDTLFEEKFELTELFDKPYSYNLKYGKDDFGTPKPSTKINLPDGSVLEIIFYLHDALKDEWELFFRRGGKINVTAEGDQYRILSTVLSVAEKVIKKYSPKIIFFTAEKDGDSTSRMKLYDKIVSRFADNAGYTAKIKTVSSERQYTLTHKMNENAPTVSAGSGAVAGIGVGPQGEPGLTPSQMKRYKKRNKPGKRLRDIISEKKKSPEDVCWPGYEMIGFKDKNGKKVPNCVSKET
jgi:hypothetical protein